jgi:hypothetical protein
MAAELYRYAADRHEVGRKCTDRAMIYGISAWRCRIPMRAVHLYFSDPWPKNRHHKRRVVHDRTPLDFHHLAARRRLRLVTDHDDLWAWWEHAAGF